MTVEQLGIARPDLRNPALAIMAEGLTEAENRYSGIPTIRREMKIWGLPEPVFQNRRNEFVVTLYNKGREEGSISPAQPAIGNPTMQDVLNFCSTPRTKGEIAKFLGVKTKYYVMHRYVNPLLEEGRLAMTIPEKPQSKLQRYYSISLTSK